MSPGFKSSGECDCPLPPFARVLRVVPRDVLQQPNLASAGAATSAAVPSADTYSADEDDEEDTKKKDADLMPNGTDKTP